MSNKAHETKECKILSTMLSARMTRTNHYVRMFSLHGKPMNSSGTTAGFQAQFLWSKESAALFRICLQFYISAIAQKKEGETKTFNEETQTTLQRRKW